MAGYTLPELFMLCRSSVVTQRILALDTLRLILQSCLTERRLEGDRSKEVNEDGEAIDVAFLRKADAEICVFQAYLKQNRSLKVPWVTCAYSLMRCG